MPRDPRTYITMHDAMPDNRKIRPLTDKAFRTIVELWCWCSREQSDGNITRQTFATFGTPKARKELIDAGLIEAHGDGYYAHDYLEHQRSKEEIEELRRKRAEAGAKGGKSQANAQANAKQMLEQNGSKPQATGEQNGSKTEAESESESLSTKETSVAEIRPDVSRLCGLLADLIEANGSKRPSITKAWHSAARLLLDTDARPLTEAENLVRWCQASTFWKPHIMSMPKFREKYDTLRLQAAKETPATPKVDPDAWMYRATNWADR